MAKNPGRKLLADIRARWPEIKKVVDAKKTSKIQFNVDSQDCQLGTSESQCFCPTARAVARATGKIAMVRHWVTLVLDLEKGVALRYMNDTSLAKAIKAFDASARRAKRLGVGGGYFQPGIYTIRRPGPRQSLNRRPPAPTVRHGSHKHKGPQDPLRQSWAEPTPRLAPVMSQAAV